MDKTADNELIAEFMPNMELVIPKNQNYKPYWKDKGTLKEYKPDGLKYHKSWEHLMPVVDKIYRLPDVRFKLENSRCRIIAGKKVFSCHTISGLNSTYACVVDFIKWYNSNPQSNG